MFAAREPLTAQQAQSAAFNVPLSDVIDVQRVDLKPFCIEIETKDKLYYFAFRTDEEVYAWMDDIYSRSPLMGVSGPTNFVHQVHVGFDPISGGFTVSETSTSARNSALIAGPASSMVETAHVLGNHQRGSGSTPRSSPRCLAVLHAAADGQCCGRLSATFDSHAATYEPSAKLVCRALRGRWTWWTAAAIAAISATGAMGARAARKGERARARGRKQGGEGQAGCCPREGARTAEGKGNVGAEGAGEGEGSERKCGQQTCSTTERCSYRREF